MRTHDLLTLLEAVYGGQSADSFEGEVLEFKADHRDGTKATLRLLAEAAVCFANGRGGQIVLGVQNRVRGQAAITGTTLDPESARKGIWERTQPALLIHAEWLEFHGQHLLLVEVPESLEIHMSDGRAPRRIGKDCHNMSSAEQIRVREDKLGVDWSALPSDLRSADISSAALTLAREYLAQHPDRERSSLSRLQDRDLLRKLGAVREDGRVSNAGAVMFSDARPAQGIVYVYRRTPGGEPTELKRLNGPSLLAYDEVMRLVSARRELTAVTLPRGQQIHIEDFPNRAVREILTNAVIHRDYHTQQPVRIAHSPQVFDVTSAGPLVAGVTPDNILTHESKPRNPLLARIARLIGLAEEVGTGIDRVFREMLSSGKDLPVIVSGIDQVKVTLAGGAPNTRVPLYVNQLPQEEREDVDALLVLFALCQKKTVHAEELAPLLQKPGRSVQGVLERLAQESVGMVEPTRGTIRWSFPRYRLRSEAMASLGTAVRYSRRLLDDLDRKIVAHVREYDKITNKTVRNLFDVDVYRSALILGDLVDRRILVRTTEHSRGPGVEYGRGPKFPRASRARAEAP